MNYAKTFRLFISSTFSDLKKERQALHERVFPEIEKYLEAKYPDYSFLPIDLRWGVNEEAQFDQKTLEVCLNEVYACKHYLHPNFLIMVGNRYGWVPLPYAIEKKEFETILDFYKNQDKSGLKLGIYPWQIQYLKKWYREDTNYRINDSNAYILKARDPEGEYREYRKWEIIENKLREILQYAANELFDKGSKKYQKYFMSATEAEVQEGIFQYLEPTDKQNDLKNEIEELPTLDKQYVFGFMREFVDTHGSKVELNDTNMMDIDRNKVSDFKKRLQETGIKVEYGRMQLNPNTKYIVNENEYIDDFTAYVISKLKSSIDEQVPKQIKDVFEKEKMAQNYFLDTRTKIFFGREKEIEKVKNYIDNPSSQPLVVCGKSGVGKSAFMAQITRIVLDKIKEREKSYPVYFRFIGATPLSTNIVSLLESIIQEFQTNEVLNVAVPKYDGDRNRFYKQVKDVLLSIQKETPVIIILDALDQLQEKDFLKWLPEELPEHVKIILSTLNEKETHHFDILKNIVNENNILSLSGVSSAEAKEILDRLLEENQRDLTVEQKKYVIKQFEKNENLPLYIKIAFEEIKTWKSFDEEALADGIDNLICEYIDNLTDKFHHDKEIVHKVLGYIKASKDGLSEKELLDLLSRDDVLLDSLEKFGHTLTLNIDGNETRRFPVSVWARLYEHLKPFLMTRFIDGQELIKFFHRQFDEVVGSYIYEEYKQTIHQKLADYFIELQDIDKSWEERYSNLHMLDELPYHLFYAKDAVRLQEILCDLEFAGSVYDHHKQDGFRQILEKANKLNDISNEEIYLWESFYREYDHLIVGHQSLFQFAYEDGLDSPLYIKAQELIANQKVNFRWLKKREIKNQMFRKGIIKAYDDVPMWALSSDCKYCVLADKTIVLSDKESMLINTKNKKIFPWKIVFKYDMKHFFAVDGKTVYKINYLGKTVQQFELEDECTVATHKKNYTFIIMRKDVSSGYVEDESYTVETEGYKNFLLILNKNFNAVQSFEIMQTLYIREMYIVSKGLIVYGNYYYDDNFVKKWFYIDLKTGKYTSLFGDFGGYIGYYESIEYRFLGEYNNKLKFRKSEPYQYGSDEFDIYIYRKEYNCVVDIDTLLVSEEEIRDDFLPETYPICTLETISSVDNKIYFNQNEYVYIDDKVYFMDHTKEYRNKTQTDKVRDIKYKILVNKNILINDQDKNYLFNHKKVICLGSDTIPNVQYEKLKCESKVYNLDGTVCLNKELYDNYIIQNKYALSIDKPLNCYEKFVYKEEYEKIYDDNLKNTYSLLHVKVKTLSNEQIKCNNIYPKDIKDKWIDMTQNYFYTEDKEFVKPIVADLDEELFGIKELFEINDMDDSIKLIDNEFVISKYKYQDFSDKNVELIVLWMAYNEFVVYYTTCIKSQELHIKDALCHYKYINDDWIDIKKYPNVVKDFVTDNSLYMVSNGELFYIDDEPCGLVIQKDKFFILDSVPTEAI